MSLNIQQLHASGGDKEILKGIDLRVSPGELHVVMGPNGSGKSTLAQVLMGHPEYTVTAGDILLNGENITTQTPDKRAQAGLFLSMQYPPGVSGVSVANLLRHAVEVKTGEPQHPVQFFKELEKKAVALGIEKEFLGRPVNVGFSGGEKKRMEMLQLGVLNPTYAILDETDSGLDVDALKVVARAIGAFATANKGVLLITHYTRILEYLNPTHVHIMMDGKIVHHGSAALAHQIDAHGYEQFV